jgi:hypothetical protein
MAALLAYLALKRYREFVAPHLETGVHGVVTNRAPVRAMAAPD